MGAVDKAQAGSPTQLFFLSVGFFFYQSSRISVQKVCFSTNTQSRFVSVVLTVSCNLRVLHESVIFLQKANWKNEIVTRPDKASRSEREEEEETTDRQSLTVMTRWATRLKMENSAEAGS